MIAVFPDTAAERDRWVMERRGVRAAVDAERVYAALVEPERFADGTVGDVATLFLTNRECPWRCTMCDLWRHTLPGSVPAGAIPRQIRDALDALPPARQIKLYNSGSFFDSRAIPPRDFGAIAALVGGFERVIVESHPALVGASCLAFQELLSGQMEVAMGLETAHPEVLARLNKRMTIAQYRTAAEFLRGNDIDLRSFVLVQPPFMKVAESLAWACRSIEVAVECGATAVTLIPTRAGNGAVDELAREGLFTPPQLSVVEEALRYGLGIRRARVFVDLWDIERISACDVCRPARLDRLRAANLSQQMGPAVSCVACGGAA